MSITSVDMSFYGEGTAGRFALQRRFAYQARNAIFDLFIKEMQPDASTTILDIGASDVENDESNVLEKRYPHPQNITCGLIGDASALKMAHPQVNIAKLVPGEALPFADKTFDVVYSNAVLEHVGGPEGRRFFLSEAARVARRVFIAIPNGNFPIEPHTGLPLLHYSPGLFRHVLRGTSYDYWSRIEELDFVTARKLRREWPKGSRPTIHRSGVQFGPLCSNLVATAQD